MKRFDKGTGFGRRGILGNTRIEVLDDVAHFSKGAIMHEVPPILELAQGQNAEPEPVTHDVMSNFCPPGVLRVVGETIAAAIRRIEMPSRQRIQGLDGMIANSNIDKILLNVLPNTGYSRIVVLLVEQSRSM